jgi:hypothetical protein
MNEPIDIAGFQRDSAFYGELHLLLTVKSFDLQAIRRRYLASRANRSGAAGSVARRDPSTGGIARVCLKQGRLLGEEVLVRTTEPRGIHVRGDSAVVAAENTVFWRRGARSGALRQPWFAYLHTAELHPAEPDRVLVSSSGFDYVVEMELESGQQTFAWLAWEHGYDLGRDPESGQEVHLTRDPQRAARLEREGRRVMLVSDPPDEAIPTARRAAFINSVTYGDAGGGHLLATFFHQGCVMRLDRDGSTRVLIRDLRNPHGGRPYRDGLLATSTASGELVLRQGDSEQRYSLGGLPGKPAELGSWEWVQNALGLGDLILAMDSNRTCFVVLDPQRGLYDTINYCSDWAVQDAAWAAPDAALDNWVRKLGAG